MDSSEAGERVSAMWQKLAEQIESQLADTAASDPPLAIEWACCAEACFWKSTGDADTHDVKDVAFADKQTPAV